MVGIDDGSNNQSLPSISEGNLNMQYTVGITTGVPIVGWLNEVNYLLAEENPPQVMTTSWDTFQEGSFSQPITKRLCQA
ncbi:hypothetical protein C8Q79DRAFT_1012504 [Trametes meyenii]|nr:hypothetical protein C8Q79DRAFT_1012504 [Trametes meyenii]